MRARRIENKGLIGLPKAKRNRDRIYFKFCLLETLTKNSPTTHKRVEIANKIVKSADRMLKIMRKPKFLEEGC